MHDAPIPLSHSLILFWVCINMFSLLRDFSFNYSFVLSLVHAIIDSCIPVFYIHSCIHQFSHRFPCLFIFINACVHALTHTIINKMDHVFLIVICFICLFVDSWISFFAINTWVNYWKNANKSQENSERITFPSLALWNKCCTLTRILHMFAFRSRTFLAGVHSCIHWGMQTLGPRPHVPIIAETMIYFVTDILAHWGAETEWGWIMVHLHLHDYKNACQCVQKQMKHLTWSATPLAHCTWWEIIFELSCVCCVHSVTHSRNHCKQIEFHESMEEHSVMHNRQRTENMLQQQFCKLVECMSALVSPKDEWMMECMHDRINDWMNERMKEGTNT